MYRRFQNERTVRAEFAMKVLMKDVKWQFLREILNAKSLEMQPNI